MHWLPPEASLCFSSCFGIFGVVQNVIAFISNLFCIYIRIDQTSPERVIGTEWDSGIATMLSERKRWQGGR